MDTTIAQLATILAKNKHRHLDAKALREKGYTVPDRPDGGPELRTVYGINNALIAKDARDMLRSTDPANSYSLGAAVLAGLPRPGTDDVSEVKIATGIVVGGEPVIGKDGSSTGRVRIMWLSPIRGKRPSIIETAITDFLNGGGGQVVQQDAKEAKGSFCAMSIEMQKKADGEPVRVLRDVQVSRRVPTDEHWKNITLNKDGSLNQAAVAELAQVRERFGV